MRRTACCAFFFAWRRPSPRWPGRRQSSTPLSRKRPPPRRIPARKGLEGLGFSVAPKSGGKARTSMFGVVAEGYKFVYVVDRSGSMGGPGHPALDAVKAEILASLKNLDQVDQFQIVCYNDRPALFNPAGAPGRLAFANDRNKQRVARFLAAIEADGGTDHQQGLRMGTNLRPDVLYWLSDGDEPKLTPHEIEQIERRAAGMVIYAIQFGDGPRGPARISCTRLPGGPAAGIATSIRQNFPRRRNNPKTRQAGALWKRIHRAASRSASSVRRNSCKSAAELAPH